MHSLCLDIFRADDVGSWLAAAVCTVAPSPTMSPITTCPVAMPTRASSTWPDLREVMRRYQDTVAGLVTRFEGHVAKFLGDGVLAFFGWPRAYEDQAERAVRSSAATHSVRTTNMSVRLPLKNEAHATAKVGSGSRAD